MSGLRVDVATAADEAGLRDLVRREPVAGRITIAYEREPDFFLGCRVLDDDPAVLVARAADGAVVGVACRSTRDVYVNGERTRLGYLGQLRIDRRFRGRWLVARGYQRLAELHARQPVPAYLAAIVDGSDEATGVLVERRRRRYPAFRPVADCRTLAFATGAGPRHRDAAGVRAATEADLAAIAAFLARESPRRQFAPVWTEPGLRRLATRFGLEPADIQVAEDAGAIRGVMAAWDQSAFKQSVVRGYGPALRLAAPFYNAGAAWLGRPRLPRAGETLRSAFAALVAVADDDAAVAQALLAATLRRAAARGSDYLLLGLDDRDPLAEAARRAAPHVTYRSRLYLADWDTEGLFHARLDRRPRAVDIATF